jgi:hypothetical protein
MPGDEVTAVHEAPVDGIGKPVLHGQRLALIVAGAARCLGVALVADLAIAGRRRAVVAQEALVVTEERLGDERPELGLMVARRALAPVEVVVVALQTNGHRGEGIGDRAVVHHTAVASDALAAHLGQLQMGRVIELDAAIGCRHAR